MVAVTLTILMGRRELMSLKKLCQLMKRARLEVGQAMAEGDALEHGWPG